MYSALWYFATLQPSSEVLYLTIFKEFRTSLVPVVLEMVEAVRGPCNPDDIIGILSKDAGMFIYV
jgi:hypothetical protein